MKLNYPHFCAEFAVCVSHKQTTLGKVLDHIINNSHCNIFSSHKGRRDYLLFKTKVSISSYERAIVRLIELKLLRKLRNESGGPYVHYEITALCWKRVELASMHMDA